MSEAVFQKHTYGKESKRTYDSLEDFDPRPLEYRGTASTNLLQLLNDVRRQGLCLSVLFDPANRCWDTSELVSTPIPNLPNKAQLKKSIEAF